MQQFDMRVIPAIEPVGAPQGSAVALGFFDGVHLGHRAVIEAAASEARRCGLMPAVFTFELPEGSTLKGGRILSTTQKHARMAAMGVRCVMEPPFADFCALTPEAFVKEILVDCFRAKAVFCGDNFTFGARAAGNVEMLRQLCAQYDIRVTVVEMARYRGEVVSSTRIRAALEEGRVADANAMLGTPYAVDWVVTHGKKVGTSKLGTPTINQNYPAGTLQPCCGVYLTRIRIGDTWYPAATGIGPRPTVDKEGAAVSCETYVPGFSGDVYGQHPVLEFHRYLCPVRKFDSLQALSDLITTAAARSCAYFSGMDGHDD